MSQDSRATRIYRFYLLDDADHIVTAHEIEAGTDEEASELAAAMLRDQARHRAIEVWERARKVCRHPPDEARAKDARDTA